MDSPFGFVVDKMLKSNNPRQVAKTSVGCVIHLHIWFILEFRELSSNKEFLNNKVAS